MMGGRFVVSLIALALACAPFAAHAQSSPPSCRIDLLEPFPDTGQYRLANTPTGARVLVFQGAIKKGEAQRLQNAITANRPIDEVWMHSPGGSALEGFAMGRVLRRAGLATRIPSGAGCFSACSTAFLGGALRIVESGGQYGVHMFTVSQADALVDQLAGRMLGGRDSARAVITDMEQTSAVLATEQSRYLLEMGISVRLADVIVRQDARGMRCLTPAELSRFNVVNVLN